ncbi:MAG: PilN domain-containing protein [Thermodesulfobacteriota bacterium]
MIRINLLPIRQLKKRARVRNQVIGLCCVFLLVIAGLIATMLWQSAQVAALQGTISGLNERKNSFNKLIKEIESLKKTREVIEAKLNVIKSLKRNAAVAVHILDEVARRTPENRMWLNSLQQSGDRLVLQGVALDNSTIAQYMVDMSTSPYFKDAELVDSSLVTVAGENLKSFTLNLAIVVQEEKPASAEKKGG